MNYQEQCADEQAALVALGLCIFIEQKASYATAIRTPDGDRDAFAYEAMMAYCDGEVGIVI